MTYLRFNRWLEDLVGADPRPGLVVFEQAHHRGGAATEVAAGFSTRVLEFCARHAIEHASVHTATLKKFATGHGNADKGAMIDEARRRFKPDLEDDNEADAVWILEWARREFETQQAVERGESAAPPRLAEARHFSEPRRPDEADVSLRLEGAFGHIPS
jgi:hypothetical protein